MGSRMSMSIFGAIFFAIGVGILSYFGIPEVVETLNFKKVSIEAPGEVVSFETRLSRPNSDRSGRNRSASGQSKTMYHPVVSFADKNGTNHQFVSKVGSSPSSYEVGDRVSVLYDPSQATKARINDFPSIWMAILIFGVLSIAFLSVGGGVLYWNVKKILLNGWLLKNGREIEGIVQEIYVDTNTKVFRKSPYKIRCIHEDELTKTKYEFTSEELWHDPRGNMKIGDNVPVLVHPDDFGKYVVKL